MKKRKALPLITGLFLVALIAAGFLLDSRAEKDFAFVEGLTPNLPRHAAVIPGREGGDPESFTKRYKTRIFTYTERMADVRGAIEKELVDKGFVREPIEGTQTAIWCKLGTRASDGSYPEAVFVTLMPGHFNNRLSTFTSDGRMTAVVVQEPREPRTWFQNLIAQIKSLF